ncbi:hypothetical protein F5Y10DRAFT_219749 [Nemania abortiva]|nr:hypothetical protein F5Y10DRAFT_219749 [Nemania abortiva]
MAPPNYTFGNAYADDRRHSGSRPESYRPGDRDRPPYRRDSRDFRDSRHPADSRDVRSPHEPRNPRIPGRDNDQPRPHVDTTFKTSETSRIKKSNSPASALPGKPGDGLHFRQMDATSQKSIAASSAILNPPTPIIPRAENPDLQEAFESAYKLGEKCNKRLLLRIRKDKSAQERAQRRLENEKFAAKAPAYPPYNGLADKFNATDRDFDDQLKVAEDEYARELEQLVARFTTAKPTVINNQDSVAAALEVKVEQMSQLVAKQTDQIRTLLEDHKTLLENHKTLLENNKSLVEDNKKSRDSISSLETNYNSIKSNYDDLKADYTALKSGHDVLESECRSSNHTIKTLQSQQANIDAENKSLRKQLMDREESRKSFENGLESRITGIEATLSEIKEKVDELDMVSFDEICTAWVSKEYTLKTLYEEYRERCYRNEPSVDDALESLRQEVESLRVGHSQSSTEAALTVQAVETIVSAKVAAAEQSISHETQTFCEGRDNILGDMIDSVSARIDVLENGAKHAGLETRIRLLEQRKATGSTSTSSDKNHDPNFAAHVGRLDGIGHRLDRIDLDVGELARKHETLENEVSQAKKRDWVDARLQESLNNFVANSGLLNDTKDLQRKIPALELAIKTLDSQFQNLTTKQLAEHIVRLTNPAFEQRLGKVEAKANQLESKAIGSDRTVSQLTEQLSSITVVLRSLTPHEKRVASPGHADEPSKKRKLEVNGRHPSPLQQQQRNS